MNSFNYFTPFEIALYLMFASLVAVQFFKKKEKRNFLPLFAGLAFGVILEIMNMYFWHTYSYGNLFIVYVLNVPLAIGVAWAVLLHISMLVSNRISRKYCVPEYILPFLDALLVFSIDVVLDVISVRYGGWSWLIPSNAEWFGVPYENFVGWISVAFIFSIIIRTAVHVEKDSTTFSSVSARIKGIKYFLWTAVPFASYIMLFIFFTIQAVFVNAIYFAMTGEKAYSGSLMNPVVIYNPQISAIKEILFLILIIMLLTVTVYYLRKADALINVDIKSKIGKIKSVVDKRSIEPIKTDAELMLSFCIIMTITSAVFLLLFMTGIYKESIILAIIQLFVIFLNLSAFLLAFGSKETPEHKTKCAKTKDKFK